MSWNLLEVVMHACNPSTWEVGAGRRGVQRHPGLYNEFEAILSYMVTVSKPSIGLFPNSDDQNISRSKITQGNPEGKYVSRVYRGN